MRSAMSLDLLEILVVIGLVIPGSMYIYLGLKTLRREWLAMESGVLCFPLIFIFFYFHFWAHLVEDIHPGGFILNIVWLFIGAITLIYLAYHGQVWVLRGNREVVLRGVRGILDKLGQRYTLEDDRFDLPEIDFMIEINHFERNGLIGIRTPFRRVPIWTKVIHEEVLNLFVGRPSDRSHPFMLIIGSVLMGLGLVLWAVFALD